MDNQNTLDMSSTTQTRALPTPISEQTYLENILRLNLGKLGTFYFTYTDSNDWRDKAYKGIIEQVGRDHFVIRDPKNQRSYILLFVYFQWAEFEEQILYASK